MLERAGVLFSHVRGERLPPSATAQRPELAGRAWEAMGVSLVLHPRNPHAPTVHLNVRCFVARRRRTIPRRCGGSAAAWTSRRTTDTRTTRGISIARAATRSRRSARICTRATSGSATSISACKHRHEPRGIGGIFYDDVERRRVRPLLRADAQRRRPFPAGATCRSSQRRKDAPYGEREREFQAYRRGRYVEFNLVWDRGTLFGLQSGGRTEAILLSMPPLVRWRYDWHPEPGTPRGRAHRALPGRRGTGSLEAHGRIARCRAPA